MSFTFPTIFLVTPPLLLASCSNNSSENSPPASTTQPPTSKTSCSNNASEDSSSGDFLNINTSEINQELKSMYVDWYQSLTNATWNKNDKGQFINYYSNSEQQSIALYANAWGWFWNEPLHHQQKPIDQSVWFTQLDSENPHEIRGTDWQFMQDALLKAVVPENMIVWHGVEYQEDEFWDQLKDYIKLNSDGTHDYSQTVGKTIESYGFISTTFNKALAYHFSGGFNFNPLHGKNDEIHMPLKEKAVFKIKLRKNDKGAAYLANFVFAGTKDYDDNQVLIKKDSKYKITNWCKDGDINLFTVDYVDA